MSRGLSDKLNAEKHRHGLSHVTFHSYGVGAFDEPSVVRAVEERVFKVSERAPIVISFMPLYERKIRRIHEFYGNNPPPKIINVLERDDVHKTTDELLTEIAEHLRKEGHM